jgi:hypothetical protein
VLYSLIKDALLSKVGVVKVWWECRDEVERETYLDQPDDAFALIVSQPGVEVVEHTEREISLPHAEEPRSKSASTRVSGALSAASRSMSARRSFETGAIAREDGRQASLRRPPQDEGGARPQDEGLPRPKLHDVTIEIRRRRECARVEGVTPEEFGISRRARSIKDTDYCFHDVFRTESQLIAQGYDREQVKKLPSYTLAHTIEEQARDTVNESTLRQGDDGLNVSSRLIRITEHYVRMNYEGNDEAALYRCTTAGEEGELLLRDGEADVVREDVIPFAAMTPVIVTHQAIAAGLVSAKNLFHSAKELVKLAGHKNVDAFFTPPGAPADPNDPASAPIAPPADPKHAEIAAKAQTEQAKITADAAHQKMKLDAQLAFEREKFALEKELKLLDLQIARERHQHDMARSTAKTIADAAAAMPPPLAS